MAKSRKEVEYEWFATRNSVSYPPRATLLDMQRIYWAKATGQDVNKVTVTDLMFIWLKSLAGVQPTSKMIPDLWREAVIGLGKIPSNDTDENRLLYFTFAP